jgi:hypothetical protein
VNAETILHATIGVLQQRGRCFNNYEYAGKVCVLGAMAVAAGQDPRLWVALQELDEEEQARKDCELVAAARLFASVAVPSVATADLEDLCVEIGRWHDGERLPGDARPENSEVFEALAKAASLAAQTGVAA